MAKQIKGRAISKEALAKISSTLSKDQKKAVEEGLKSLSETDPATLAKMAASGDHVVLCDCGPNGEPGLTRW